MLYSFSGGSDGSNPQAGLVQGTDGNLYGTTLFGGPSGYGAVFKVTPGGAETVLHLFAGGSDGNSPQVGLVQGTDGNFYGTTPLGGNNNDGTVFSITPEGVETVLHSFGNYSFDAILPDSALIQGADGDFYGTSYKGGSSGVGTVFKVTSAGVATVIYSFAGGTADGAYPSAALVQGTDGNFYGMTTQNGANGMGTVFRLTPAGEETVLHNFAGGTADGAYPEDGLVQGPDGNFYGTTRYGGAGVCEGSVGSCGTIFRITPSGVLTVLYSFAGAGVHDEAIDPSGLIVGADGNFYGMTIYGGAYDDGMAFMVTPAGSVTVLYSFASGRADGQNPFAGLIQGVDGNFYGTTTTGGTDNGGTVFKLVLP